MNRLFTVRPGQASRRPGLAVVGIILFASCSLGYQHFFSGANLSAIGLNSASLLLAAVGSMALLVSGNIDLSIGSQYAFISVLVALVAVNSGNSWLAALVGIAAGLGCGLINGLLVTWLSISPLIVTLAMLAIYSGLAYVVHNGQSVYGLPDALSDLGESHVAGVPTIVIIAVVVYAGCSLYLMTSRTGLRLFSIGGNRTAALLVGIPVDRMVVGAYAVNGALIGFVALLSTAQLNSGSPTVGVDFELNVLTAVILGGVAFTGGIGNPIGVVVGVAVIGVLDAGLIFAGLADWWQQIARGSLLLLALAADQLILQYQRRVLTRQAGEPMAPIEAAGWTAVTDEDGCPLRVDSVSVHFAGVRALDRIDLDIPPGEVVCLVGDNGAGKSTLLKVICGALAPTTGSVRLGRMVVDADPQAGRRLGIETVHQQPALCWNLGTAENLALGVEPMRWRAGLVPTFDRASAEREAAEYLAAFGLRIEDLRQPIANLSNGEQQMMAILRVLRSDARAVLLDEPTAALGIHQTSEVLRLVRSIAEAGRPVLMVTHDVEEVFSVADRVVVLQQGRLIFDGPVADVTRLELLQLMSGRSRAEAARTDAAIRTERRRIERDLHDGAQQHLVNAAMLLGLAADQLRGANNEHLAELVASTQENLSEALQELRNLSRGIYPAVLSERGLGAALDSLATRSPLPVELADGGVPRLGGDTELVAYFVAAEALTNVQKHARATGVVITLGHGDGELRMEISDDGIGGADETAGSGLLGLRGRVAAAGGTFHVDSSPERGTTIQVTLPAVRQGGPVRA
ncbi:MAG TPA: ATP-binding cassette domain-containing protein [Acidimicrobiales bacterium]|jgi:ribose/xylose/arabinose/galactoside ABC-type transport system permease subunit/ABC-type multidrug transport system ATPase subunit|nr:ATP-binding cassette domain-containing protein [Acidimicrobiales bacterium]